MNLEKKKKEAKTQGNVAAGVYVTYLHKILLSICRYYKVIQASIRENALAVNKHSANICLN